MMALHDVNCLPPLQIAYEVKKICACEIIDDKNPSRTLFRIVRLAKDGNYKNVDFEASHAMTST